MNIKKIHDKQYIRDNVSKQSYIASNKSIQIVFDASIFEIPLTGVGKTTLFLYEACKKINPNINFIGIHKNKLHTNYPSFLKFIQIGESGWKIKNVDKYFSNHGHAIAHFPWNGPIPFPLKIPVAMTLHDVLPLEIPGYLGRNPLRRWSFIQKTQKNINRSDTVFTDSQYSKNKIINAFKIKEEPIVNYFGATLKLPQNSGCQNSVKDNLFVYVGGYDPRKGIVPMLKSFIQLRKQLKIASKLIMTGTKYYFSEEFRTLLNEGENAGYIEQRGYISDEDLVELFLKGKGLIYLSKYEGFGLPPLEAMHVGCPVITTKGTSIPEVCGDAALYVNPDNNNEISAAIESLEKNDDLRKDLIEKGKRQSALFSWEKCAETFLSEIISKINL